MGLQAGSIGGAAAAGGGPGLSLGAGSLALQGIGAASTALSGYYSAKSQQATLNYQADIEDINARQSELAAQQQLLNGNTEIANLTRQAGQFKSRQRAAIAANGIALDSANASEVLASTDISKEQDMDTLSANAIRAAWGYRTEAINQRNDAMMKRTGAGSIDPGMAFSTSLLGSAGQVASSWYMLNKVGAK